MQSEQTTPAVDDDERLARIRLSQVPGIGAILFHRLLRHAGRAGDVFRLPPSRWASVSGIGPAKARQILGELRGVDPEPLLQQCKQEGVAIIVWGEPNYPRWLQEIADPPPVLFLRGALAMASMPAIAIVGSRHMTHYGSRVTRQLTEGLVQAGLSIISGLARGVDRVAHETALACGGRTVAVIGSGHRRIYPSEHTALADRLVNDGLILSEYPPDAPVKSIHFPQRNRIIAGLALGVVVVEAAARSGALITARHAVEQNRDVFAVPGSVEQRMSRGCHGLIKAGAKLVETTADILDELSLCQSKPNGPAHTQLAREALEKLTLEQRQILEAIEPKPTPIDEVIGRTELSAQSVLASLFVLEQQGLIQRPSGGAVIRAW